ncbi:hypothetical protein HQ544_03965 [Candidatus Falkowbacteria bacterium]|nr:hypothetical protein [Candidatus Falkowbacteria bacterium]
MASNLTTIGHWALIVGILLAVIAGFTTVPSLTVVLFILGLVIGFLNIKDKESTPFLIAVIALLLIGVAGLQLGKLTDVISSILENFIALVAAAGLVVAIKEVATLARGNS